MASYEAEWQPSFDDLGRNLIDTTFVVVDLETTGGSPKDASITEIGAVKVRGGEVIGEFQTLVNPGLAIPPFITVLTGITDAMVISAPQIGEALFSFLEFAGSPEENVLVAHNAPFDIGFLKAASSKFSVKWPNFQVVDTARISRYALSRDEVRDFKLSSLATFFAATTQPDHRALSDARATVDVLHGVLERLGSLGVSTLDDLKSFTNRVTDAQRKKRHFADGLSTGPGVYIFRDVKGEPLYIGKTQNLRNRVKTYFTSAETRKRIHDMVALADRVEVFETPTIIEAEIRELRMISSAQPRFNRRSRFQEKAIWLRLSQENYPRLVQVRGAEKIEDSSGWCGPFNGREEATKAMEAIYEVFPIRQCVPKITLSSMKRSSPCALLDLRRCGAPCIGAQSIDTYSSLVTEVKFALHENPRAITRKMTEKMQELSLQERFEEAAAIRDRMSALIRASARGQRIRSLTAVEELIAAKPVGSNWELTLIRYGRLAASWTCKEEQFDEAVNAIRKSGEVVLKNGSILPASTYEEVEVLLRYLNSPEIRIIDLIGQWSSPAYGAGQARAELEASKQGSANRRYKEEFTNSFERSIQR
jgi:DNA polymerase-3 subunit epsilon